MIPNSSNRINPYVFQVARHCEATSGVARVVYELEQCFNTAGVPNRVFTLEHLGLKLNIPVSRRFSMKLLLLLEVVYFSVGGSILVLFLRLRFPNARIIVHGDPLGGDVYVNHGLLKASFRERWAARRRVIHIPTNPMHWFTLARDRIRYEVFCPKKIVCLTNAEKERLLGLYPKCKSKIVIIPNGIDLAEFAQINPKERGSQRETLMLGADVFVLLFVGNEFSRKGLTELMASLKYLPEKVVLTVVGGTPEMIVHAKHELRVLGVSQDRVLFQGQKDDVSLAYSAADLFVMPTRYESFGLVYLEALARGIPVLGTPVGVVPELAEHCASVFLLPSTRTQPEEIANSILAIRERILDSPSLVRADIIHSRRYIATNYCWPRIAARYLDLVNDAE